MNWATLGGGAPNNIPRPKDATTPASRLEHTCTGMQKEYSRRSRKISDVNTNRPS
jgi:hypothetical protein